MQQDQLSETFAALADPTRRAILARLAEGEASVNELAEPFEISLPAVSRHLRVLEQAGLISRSRAAQSRPCKLEIETMKQARDWLETYKRFWTAGFDRMDDMLKDIQAKRAIAMTETDDVATEDLTIVRTFDAPRALVFEMWTNPEYTLRWMGPRDYPATLFEQDVRVGGNWRGCLSAADDPDRKLWQGGRYLEIVPPEKLVFTFAWADGPETVVTVLLTEEAGRTRMVFHQTPFRTSSSRDGHGHGWNSAFDRMVDLLPQTKGNA